MLLRPLAFAPPPPVGRPGDNPPASSDSAHTASPQRRPGPRHTPFRGRPAPVPAGRVPSRPPLLEEADRAPTEVPRTGCEGRGAATAPYCSPTARCGWPRMSWSAWCGSPLPGSFPITMPPPGRRPAMSLGTIRPLEQAHPCPGPPRVPTSARQDLHASRSAETLQTLPRTTTGLEEPPTHQQDRHQSPQDGLTSTNEDQHTEYLRYEERAKLTAVRALVPVAILVSSPVLLVAGPPIRRRYLRYIHREDAPQILNKGRGQVSVHYFVVTNPLLEWICRPAEALARLISPRG